MSKALFHDHAEHFEAIILDLGGVLLNLDYGATSKAFKAHATGDFDALFAQASQSDLFDRLETGKISPADFREALRELGFAMNDDELDSCWNAMLLDLPASRLDYIDELCMRSGLILLSNTNEIHIQRFEEAMKAKGQWDRFSGCFVEMYYSSRIGKRKPDISTFKWVLEDNGLSAGEVLFIDDTLQHVEGARAAGLTAYHLQKGEEIADLFG